MVSNPWSLEIENRKDVEINISREPQLKMMQGTTVATIDKMHLDLLYLKFPSIFFQLLFGLISLFEIIRMIILLCNTVVEW